MSFDTRIIALAERFLSAESVLFIVRPAVADLQFEDAGSPAHRLAGRIAVLRAVAGGARQDLGSIAGEMLVLTLVPICYHAFLLVLCFDVMSLTITRDLLVVAALIIGLSFAMVAACFWPERGDASPVE